MFQLFFWLVGIQLVSQRIPSEIRSTRLKCRVVAPLITTNLTTNPELVSQIFGTHVASMFKWTKGFSNLLFDIFDAVFFLS